jgi:hypothetical protein
MVHYSVAAMIANIVVRPPIPSMDYQPQRLYLVFLIIDFTIWTVVCVRTALNHSNMCFLWWKYSLNLIFARNNRDEVPEPMCDTALLPWDGRSVQLFKIMIP